MVVNNDGVTPSKETNMDDDKKPGWKTFTEEIEVTGQQLLETINSLSWAGLGWFLISATTKTPSGTDLAGTAIAFACTFLTLLAAWLLRRPQA